MQTTTLLYTSEWIKKYRFNLLTICSYKRVTELGRKFHVLRGINHGALAYSQKLRHKSSTVRMISIHYDNRNYPAISFRYSLGKWPSSYDCSLWSNLKSRSRLKYDFILNGTSKHIVWIKMKKKERNQTIMQLYVRVPYYTDTYYKFTTSSLLKLLYYEFLVKYHWNFSTIYYTSKIQRKREVQCSFLSSE